MMILTFDEPQKLTDYFDVPLDTTSWNMLYRNIPNNIKIPNRQPNFKVSNSLKLKTGVTFPSEYGLFILAMDKPRAIFIGYAAEDSKQPEGITNRLKKYRSHITGSNLGNGVHHPEVWQTFTKARFDYFQSLNKVDDCADVRFVIGKMDSIQQEKLPLEYCRYRIVKNSNNIRDEIYSRLWNGGNNGNVICLNDRVQQGKFNGSVILWSKEI
jgi:hypothetical protein